MSELVRRVEAGEEIIIARGDTPVSILRDFKREDIAARRKAAFGCLAGQFPLPDDSVVFGGTSDAEFSEMFGTVETAPIHLGRPLRSPRNS